MAGKLQRFKPALISLQISVWTPPPGSKMSPFAVTGDGSQVPEQPTHGFHPMSMLCILLAYNFPTHLQAHCEKHPDVIDETQFKTLLTLLIDY